MKFFSTVLSEINFFKFPIDFFINSKKKFSSVEGRIISFCILAILVYNFASSDMISKKNPIIFEKYVPTISRVMSFNNFNFAPVLFLYSAEINNQELQPKIFLPDPSYFNLSIITIKSQNNSKNIFQKFYKIHNCTSDDFPNFINST